ncbi:DUF58 domain-containing protein [Planctomycetia bacterium]|nr:DUF58 domain-containing protein [Planctomycetia bacterium]
MRFDPEVQQAAARYQLGLPRMPVSGRSGELLGRGTGSSLEFQEYREYQIGDDIRHLDWAAYARTDAMMVRLYREEISPRMEILLDASRSMTSVDPTGSLSESDSMKARAARQLAGLFALLGGNLGGRPVLIPITDRTPLEALPFESHEGLNTLRFDGSRSLREALDDHAIPLKRQTVRVVISDFLFPHDPDLLMRRLAGDASVLWVLQVLNAWEAKPTTLGGRKLVDLETTEEANLQVVEKTIAEYSARLLTLQQELSRACRRVHATFAILIADRGLLDLCGNELCAAEILRPT